MGDSKDTPEDFGNTHGRPAVALKTERFGSTGEQRRQLAELFRRKCSAATRSRTVTQGVRAAALTSAADPLADRSLSHAEFLGDLALQPTLLVQFPRP